MAKSDKVVNEDADAVRRFEALEQRSEKTESMLEAISKKLGIGEEPKPDPKPDSKPKPNDPAPTTRTGITKILEDIGLIKPNQTGE